MYYFMCICYVLCYFCIKLLITSYCLIILHISLGFECTVIHDFMLQLNIIMSGLIRWPRISAYLYKHFRLTGEFISDWYIYGDGQFQKFTVFNFAIVLKSQKFDTREIYAFHIIQTLRVHCRNALLTARLAHRGSTLTAWLTDSCVALHSVI